MAWDQRIESEIEYEHARQLRLWAPMVGRSSTFWKSHFNGAGLSLDEVVSIDALKNLPSASERQLIRDGHAGLDLVMRPTEDHVKANAPRGVIQRLAGSIRRDGEAGKRRVLLEEYKPIHVHAGGRDGQLPVAYSRSDLDRLHLAGSRAARVLGLADSDYIMNAVPSGPRLAFWGMYHLALGASILAVHPRAGSDALDAAVPGFGLIPATCVSVPKTEAVEFAALLLERSVDLSNVRTVLTVGVPPSAELRIKIADAWRAAGARSDLGVLALWAPPESRFLWPECRSSGRESFGLHTMPDLEVVEAADPATGTSLSGAGGDLTLTSLGWHGTALIRYATGDHVSEIAEGACPNCGRTVPRIVGVVSPGAWQPVLKQKAGPSVRADLRAVARVLTATEPSWRVELRRAKDASEGIVVRLGRDLSAGEKKTLAEALADASAVAPQIATETAQKIAAGIERFGVFADRR